MNRIGYLYRLMVLAGGLIAGWGCTEEFPTGNKADTEGLVLKVSVGDTPATSLDTRAANDLSLNEAYIKTVDVFFLAEGSANVTHYVPKVSVTNGKAVLASGTWKDTYRGKYDVYVLANKHDYDNPLTAGTVETDLSWVTTKTQLLALTDTDTDVAKAEGENYGQDNIYSGKTFLMDGSITGWDADAAEANATISVPVAHAAAKLRVNVSYTAGFLTDGRAITSVTKKLVHYVRDAKAFAEGGSIDLTEPQEEAGSDGFSFTNSATGEGIGRRDVLYAYSYPNEWGTDIAERETYFLVNIPYTDDGGEPHQNYYKVPVRISGNTDDLKLDRNTEYIVNVTVDRVGNETIDEPETLTPTFSVAAWKPESVDVEGDMPNYLMLSDDYIEMNNVADTTITFFSSSAITVEVKEVYFLDKNGNKDENYTIPAENGWEEDINIELKPLVKANWDSGKLQGSIKISSEIPTNVTARYITLEVTNTDGLKKTISIVQYPLEYISGVPGVYATRSDFELTGNTYDNYVNKVNVGNNVKLDTEDDGGGWLDSPTFQSKVYTTARDGWNDKTGIFYVTTKRSGGNYTLVAGDFDDGHDNNRMYLVQITSTSGGHTVARPAMDGTGEDIVTKSNDENNRLVSPMFMLASQLGTVYPADWTTAQEHCKEYVEVAKYEDGTTRRFADWRLPTFAELQVIAQYQNKQPEVMDVVLAGATYWSAHELRYLQTNNPQASDPTVGNSRTECYIRCIRDVTPEDLEEFRAHGVK